MSLRFRFGRRHHAEDEDSGETYLERLAVWQLEHRLDRHDMTVEQEARWRIHVKLADSGVDPGHAVVARLRYLSGKLNDDKR